MKALILNSGMGNRMGDLTSDKPKCMLFLNDNETILSRQLKQLALSGVTEIVMTTGRYHQKIRTYTQSLKLPLEYTFISNPHYESTNYIYSIYLARKVVQGDLLLLHGDLVLDDGLLRKALSMNGSVMAVDYRQEISNKDFKVRLDGDRICKISVYLKEQAYMAQPFYKLEWVQWQIWLKKITAYCESGKRTCYAEEAFNEVSEDCRIKAMDIGNYLCMEVDTTEDLEKVRKCLE